MLKPVLYFLLLCLAACTTMAGVQRDCALLAGSFPAEVSCIAETVSATPGLRGDSFVREYVMTGEQLAARFRRGEISEAEARLQFASAYNRLVLQQKQYSAYSAIEHDALRLGTITCHESGGFIHCTSF